MKTVLKTALGMVARPLSYLSRAVNAADSAAIERAEAAQRQQERLLAIEEALLQARLAAQFEALQARIRADMPDSPAGFGFKVYSQTDEDGILEQILGRILSVVPLSRTFIEIGCGDGRENNTHYLALQGFRGCWCDGSSGKIDFIEHELGGRSFPRLTVTHRFLDSENTAPFIKDCVAFLADDRPDLLSVDVDGNDVDILRMALTVSRPKVLCVEYNAKFPPPLSLAMTYHPEHVWTADDYQGASLAAWRSALPEYMLAACTISGVNAFFVHRDYTAGFVEYPLGHLYQPARHHLIHLAASGHLPSLKWLRQIVRTI